MLARAIEKFPGASGEQCDYRYHLKNNDEPVAEVTFDAQLDRFELISVGGTAPSKDDRDDFEPPRGARHPAAMALDDLEQPFEFAGETDGLLEFSFVPVDAETKKEIDAAVTGAVWVDPRTEELKRMRIWTSAPFSPAFMVKLREFDQHFSFVHDPVAGGMVIERMSFRIEGRALAFKKLDERMEMVFDQFRCPSP